MVVEALLFGVVALVPLYLFQAATQTLRHTMQVTVTYKDPPAGPGGLTSYPNVTAVTNDGKVVKITYRGPEGQTLEVHINWDSILKLDITH